MPYLVGYITPQDYGAKGDGTTDDTTAIQAAINACAVDNTLYFPPNTYRTSSPLTVPPGVKLKGEQQRRPRNSFMSDPNLADVAIIKPLSSFTGSSVIYVPDTLAGGWSTMAQGTQIEGLKIDATAIPSGSADGVRAYGQVQGLILDNVSVFGAPGYCFNFARNTSVTSGPNNPFSIRVRGCYAAGGGTATTTGGFFIYNCTDSTFIDCETIGVGGDGWTIQGGGNTHFVACRSENNTGNGFTLDQTAVGSNAVANMVSCSTSSNTLNGFNVVNAQAVHLTDCISASGEGATSASFNVASATGLTSLNSCSSVVGGTSKYGILVSSNLNLSINGGSFYGTTSGFHDGGGNTNVFKSPNVIELTGSSGSPTVSVNGVQTGEGGLGIGQAPGGGNTLKITSNTSAALAITGTAVGQQVVGVTAADVTSAAYQAEVTGDTVNRYRVFASGEIALGSGSATRDTFTGRAAAGTYYVNSNLLLGSSTALGDNGVGELQLADATTVPTTNPTGGGVIYAVGGAPYHRGPNGNVSSLISGPQSAAITPGALADTLSYSEVKSNGTPTSGTLYIQKIFLSAGTTISNIGFTTYTTGATGPTHWWTALLDNTYKQQAHSADQTTTAINASTWYTLAMATPFVTVYTGIYFLSFMIATTSTQPSLLQCGNSPQQQFFTGTNAPTPVPNGASTASLTTPGTDGTTVYAAPTTASPPFYLYCQ